MDLPNSITVINGLLYSKETNCIISHTNRRIKNPQAVPESIRSVYERWSTYSKGTIFKVKCPAIPVKTKTFKLHVSCKNSEEPDVYQVDAKAVIKDCYAVYVDGKRYFVFNGVEVSNDFQLNAHKVTFGMSGKTLSMNESPSAMVSIYNIHSFAKIFQTFSFNITSVYFDVSKRLVYCLFQNFKSNQVYFQIEPISTHKNENTMYYHTAFTIKNYLQHITHFIYYMLNLKEFSRIAKFNIDQVLIDLSEELNFDFLLSNVSKQDHQVDSLLIQKMRGFLVKLLQQENAFSVVVKACFINDDLSVKADIGCGIVFNSIKFFVKYMLVYTEDGKVPKEYNECLVNFWYSGYNTLLKVGRLVREKCSNIGSNYSVTESNGSCFVNSVEFNPKIFQKVFHSLLDLYDKKINDLLDYNLRLLGVDSCYDILRFKYRESPGTFYDCYPITLLTDVYNKSSGTFPKDNATRLLVFSDINEMTHIILCLVYLSSGGLVRLFEMAKFSGFGFERAMFLYCDSDKEYVYFKSTVNKNKSKNQRIVICHSLVTKYIIHYMVIVKSFLKVILEEPVVDPAINSFFGIASTLNIEDVAIDEFESINENQVEAGESFFDYYIFILVSIKNKQNVVSNANTSICQTLMNRFTSGGYRLLFWRQFFMHVAEMMAFPDYSLLVDYINKVVYKNSGHSETTHLNWYTRLENSSQFTRCSEFNITFDIMIKTINYLLDTKESTNYNSRDNWLLHHSPCVFTPEQIHAVKNLLYPNIVYRPYQESLIAAIAMAHHNYVLQAQTGFGKTHLFSTIIKLFNIHYPGFLNVLVLPYTTLKGDMIDRLLELGFSVGSFGSLSTEKENMKDVYVGIYDEIPNDLSRRTNTGLVVFDEAHCISHESSFRDVLLDMKKFNFNTFKKILLVSATLDEAVAQDVFEKIGVFSKMVYSNVVETLPISNIYSYSLDHLYEDTEADRTALLFKILESFTVNLPDSKAVVFFNNKSVLDRFSPNFLTISGDNSSVEKLDKLHRFKNDTNVILGTKLISNGLNITKINLIVFYNYVPDAIDLIQAMGRVRNKGLILFINPTSVCVQSIMEKFYGLKKKKHVNCCMPAEDKHLESLKDLVVYNKMEGSDATIPFSVKKLRNTILNMIDRTVFDQFVPSCDTNLSKEYRIINDPFFLFCYAELKDKNKRLGLVGLQKLFVGIFIGKTSSLSDADFQIFMAKSEMMADYYVFDEDVNNNCNYLQFDIPINHFRSGDVAKYINADYVFNMAPPYKELCPRCYQIEHGDCDSDKMIFFILACFIKKVKLRTAKSSSHSLFSLYFLEIFSIQNGMMNLYSLKDATVEKAKAIKF